VAALHNAAVLLRHLADSGWTPRLIDKGEDWITQEDLGVSGRPADSEAFRHNCIRMLHDFRQRGVRHGDLTSVNLIIRGNRPQAIDWQEGHFLGQSAPQKQPWSDSYLICRTIADYGMDSPRVARRWMAMLQALGAAGVGNLPLKGQAFLDLGCYEGDMVALASAEGMTAEGVDMGGFRSGVNSIETARGLWAHLPCLFTQADVFDLPANYFARDVVTCLSTWPYLVKDRGQMGAEALLATIVGKCGVLFFETQLKGDGPGPGNLPDLAAVEALLRRVGGREVRPIITVPVDGRKAERTTWEVKA
jgi:hypothetical protein